MENRLERKKHQTRQRILENARRMIEANGFESVTVEGITVEADVAKGTFFNYFPTKNHLLLEFWSDVVSDILTEFRDSLCPDRGARESIVFLFDLLIRRLREYPKIFEALLTVPSWSKEFRSYDESLDQEILSVYESILRGSLLSNGISPDIDVRIVAEAVENLWVGTLRKWLYYREDFDIQSDFARKLDLLLKGVVC